MSRGVVRWVMANTVEANTEKIKAALKCESVSTKMFPRWRM